MWCFFLRGFTNYFCLFLYISLPILNNRNDLGIIRDSLHLQRRYQDRKCGVMDLRRSRALLFWNMNKRPALRTTRSIDALDLYRYRFGKYKYELLIKIYINVYVYVLSL